MIPRPRRTDRGSITLEAVLITPALLLVLAFLAFAARYALAHQAVQTAASEAARSASIARAAGPARSSAEAAAEHTLANQGVTCASQTVTVDTAGFASKVGAAADVTATIRCVVNVADLALPGTPGTVSVSASASSPLDRYRGRS